MIETPHAAPDRSAWQFSLRSMLIGVTLFGMVLGFGMWLDGVGAMGCLFVIGLTFLGHAIYLRHKRRILLTSILLLMFIAVTTLMYFFGPHKYHASRCSVCGCKKVSLTFYGIKIYQKESETEISKWAHQFNLVDPHKHRWIFEDFYEQCWGGSWQCYDYFDMDLDQITSFWDASKIVDQDTFNEMAKEYHDIGDDTDRERNFCNKCMEIIAIKRNQELRDSARENDKKLGEP